MTGSLPCIPARHDILRGSLDFLWRPWGSIELWERPVARRIAGQHHLYDVDVDPDERENRAGEPLEKEMLDLLHEALTAVSAPEEQYLRVGVPS